MSTVQARIQKIRSNIDIAKTELDRVEVGIGDIDQAGRYDGPGREEWSSRGKSKIKYLKMVFGVSDRGGYLGPDGKRKAYIGRSADAVAEARRLNNNYEIWAALKRLRRRLRDWIADRQRELEGLNSMTDRILDKSCQPPAIPDNIKSLLDHLATDRGLPSLNDSSSLGQMKPSPAVGDAPNRLGHPGSVGLVNGGPNLGQPSFAGKTDGGPKLGHPESVNLAGDNPNLGQMNPLPVAVDSPNLGQPGSRRKAKECEVCGERPGCTNSEFYIDLEEDELGDWVCAECEEEAREDAGDFMEWLHNTGVYSTQRKEEN